MTDTTASTETSPHHDLVTAVFDGRTAVGQPAVAPDGKRIAFVVSRIDVGENTTTTRVWLTSSTGGDTAPLTAGPHDGAPAFSPDGRFLAFTSRRGEKDKEATLHVLPVDGPGEVRTVATMVEGFGEPTWSPDGKWIAFTSRTRDARYEAKDESWQSPRKIETFFTRLNGEGWVFDRPTHVYVVAADGTGAPRNLTPGEHQHEGIAWLPDSAAILTSASRHEGWDRDLVSDIYIVPLDGEVRRLTSGTGENFAPSVSPDGKRFAVLGVDDPLLSPQNIRVGVGSLDDGVVTWVSTGLDRTFSPTTGGRAPLWRSDDTLLALAEDRGDAHLYELAADGATAPRPITSGAISITGFDAAGDTVAMTETAVDHPAELVTLDGPITNITARRRGWEKFAVPCSDGSGEIDAWIMRPADFDESKSYPVLLNVHGGPFTQYGEYFFDEAQLQSDAGFVVLMSNPRGSSGREESWGQAINGPKQTKAPGTGWGSVDVDDVIAVLDHALATYSFCDAKRVGMLGGSYGGYMATTLAGRFSDRFGAICTERAVNNWLTEEVNADISSVWHAVVGVNAIDDPDEYARMSPIRHVRDIDVPLLIIHSEEDWRCPINQAEELFVAMRLLDKDVTFYRFPGENHELSRSGSPVHRVMRGEIILDFFKQHLDS